VQEEKKETRSGRNQHASTRPNNLWNKNPATITHRSPKTQTLSPSPYCSLHSLPTIYPPNPHIPRPRITPNPATPPLVLPRRCTSTLSLLALSKLRLTLLLLLLLLARLVSAGSCGLSPLALANRFRISVRLTTPDRRPDMLAPGMATAEMAGAGVTVAA
jgi:hypothetical protein